MKSPQLTSPKNLHKAISISKSVSNNIYQAGDTLDQVATFENVVESRLITTLHIQLNIYVTANNDNYMLIEIQRTKKSSKRPAIYEASG